MSMETEYSILMNTPPSDDKRNNNSGYLSEDYKKNYFKKVSKLHITIVLKITLDLQYNFF